MLEEEKKEELLALLTGKKYRDDGYFTGVSD